MGARIVVQSRYSKKGHTGIAALLDYMASRPGVVFETKQEEWMNKDATEKQKNLINELLELNPELNELLEYEDYKLNPTIANASEFLDAAKENMMNSEFEADTLVQYMAERPGVVKNEATHGLFSSGGTIDLEKAKEAVSNHPGNIWTNIISLRREDAHRLGYETQEAWKDAVYCALPDIQKAMKINAENFRWYAAFHDTGRHPHIHLMVYSADGKSGYLNKEGIKEIKRAFSTHIFADERAHIYSMKDEYRQEMRTYTEERIQNLIREIDANPTPTNAPALEKKMKQLSDALKDYKGRAVYQYLPKDIKVLADDVMIEFSKDRRVHEIYSGWCNLENELQEMYKNNPDDPELLVNNKAFLPIKNEIIGQAHRLAKQTVFKEKAITLGIPEERVPWLSEEKTDALLRKAFEAENPEFSAYLEKAEKGDVDAQYKVGHLYYYGTDDIERDYREGRHWLKKAADGGHPIALFEMGKFDSRSKDSVTKQIGFEKLELAFRGLSDFAEYDIGAQKALAEYYQKGLLFEPDPEAAAYWNQRAADQNINKQASFFDNLFTDEEDLLEEWYNRTEQAREDKQKNKAHASEWYQSAKKYLKTNDIEKAKEFFILAAEQGHSFAQYNLGQIYAEEAEACQNETLHGELMEQSQTFYAKALKEFLQSETKTGDAMFQNILGRMYYQGLGTEPDFKKSFAYYLKAAEQNDPNAQYRVGRMFLAGEGTEQNITSAIEWLEKAANQENSFAQYALGKIYFDGKYVPKNLKQAHSWLQKASDNHHCFADYILGKMYAEGHGVDKNPNAADFYFKKALASFTRKEEKSHDIMLQNLIARMYYQGLGTEPNFKKAFAYYLKAAEQNDPHAQYHIGRMFLAGEGTDRNITSAIEWLEKAAAQEEDGAAAYQLAKIYLSEEDPALQDTAKAKEYFMQAAEQGHSFAQYNLGRIYAEETEACRDETLHGELMEHAQKFYAKALDGFLQSEAQTGDVMFQSLIARMYYQGLGTEPNFKKAFAYYLKAAEQNDPHAQYHIGRMFLAGEGTEKNITSAIEWLEKAAAQEEDGAAAYRLGKIYLEGRDFVPDLNKARFWLEKAALTEKQFAPYALGKCYLSIARGMHETDYRHYCRLAMNCFITAGNAGNAYAVYQQGNMFLYGRGVERDFEKANLLFRQADSMGCEQARERVEQLNQKPTIPAAGIAGAFAAVLRMMSQNMEPSRLQPQQSTNRQQRIKESRLKDAQGIKME